MIIKICGIQKLNDALLCVSEGAGALGFNFYPKSPRYIAPEAARTILDALPRTILKVAVVVRGSVPEDLPDSIDILQYHGARSEDDLPSHRLLWVAVEPDQAANAFPARRILIDPSWGRGRQADWDSLRDLDRDYILSGGLSAENVGRALATLRPQGVDVCSGVESSPGVQDPARIRAFLQATRRALSQRSNEI